MLASKKTKRGVIGAIVLAGVLSVSGYALTNALTVDDLSNVGDGEAPVSDVTVDDDSIDYTLVAADPSTIETIEFSMTLADGAPLTEAFLATSEVWIQVVD